jgi:hypothetical protein
VAQDRLGCGPWRRMPFRLTGSYGFHQFANGRSD